MSADMKHSMYQRQLLQGSDCLLETVEVLDVITTVQMLIVLITSHHGESDNGDTSTLQWNAAQHGSYNCSRAVSNSTTVLPISMVKVSLPDTMEIRARATATLLSPPFPTVRLPSLQYLSLFSLQPTGTNCSIKTKEKEKFYAGMSGWEASDRPEYT